MSSQIWIIVAVIALCCVSSSLLTASGGFGLYQYNKTHSTTPWSCIYVPTIKMYTVARSTRTTPSACTTLTQTLNLDIYTCGPNSTNYKLWNRTGYEAANDPCDVILNSDNRSIVNMLFAPSTTSINSAYPPPAATS
ncbi:uncharacterized protein BJ171DRAFT_580237 [Polychytrium aggregatum]|uniref:uncharacterized protein n=1 Tax=Polychytrium aggregatum TaxID=110093 RepID=UPI0022FEF57D|nr:uncharacterized protein BJ171DRAFT_580237 [Polychytrium aggregatum]KAI9206162.1 hypothetical protein BJ171DRAFT_580237 [Polychytrium aggregatum]